MSLHTLEVYNKAIEVDPNDFKIYLNKGAVLIGLGEYELAVNSYDKVIELNPTYSGAYSNKHTHQVKKSK